MRIDYLGLITAQNMKIRDLESKLDRVIQTLNNQRASEIEENTNSISDNADAITDLAETVDTISTEDVSTNEEAITDLAITIEALDERVSALEEGN